MTIRRRTIEVDDTTADALESRAAEAGVSVSDLLAQIVTPAKVPAAEIEELDRQWAAIKAGEPTVPHDEVVRWLETWGTPRFRACASPTAPPARQRG
jgi:predicted transcriptional regulator